MDRIVQFSIGQNKCVAEFRTDVLPKGDHGIVGPDKIVVWKTSELMGTELDYLADEGYNYLMFVD